MRSLGRRLYPSGYGISPRVAALPGSQFSIKEGEGTALRTLAASAPVAVLQAASFSRIKIRPSLPTFSAACLPMRTLVVEAPEVETPDAIGGECLGQRNGAVEHLALLFVRKARMELVLLGAES